MQIMCFHMGLKVVWIQPYSDIVVILESLDSVIILYKGIYQATCTHRIIISAVKV